MQWEVVSLEGRVEDTQRSCIPIDTEEGFLLHSCKDGRQRERKEVGGEHHISVILSQHVNVMHVLIELEGHVLRGSYGLKLSSKRGL